MFSEGIDYNGFLGSDFSEIMDHNSMKSLKKVWNMNSTQDLAIAIAICIFSFSIYLMLTIYWYNIGLFDQYNIFFDTDPNERLSAFAHGWSRSSFVHAGLTLLSLPIRGIIKLAHIAGLVGDEKVAHEWMALMIAPASGALFSFSAYIISRILGYTKNLSVLLALLGVFSFTVIIFSATPDHFMISGGLIALGFLFYILDISGHNSPKLKIWTPLFIAVSCITVTNLVSLALLVFFAEIASGKIIIVAVRRSLFLTIVGIISAYLISTSINYIYSYSSASAENTVARIEKTVEGMANFSRIYETPNKYDRLISWPRYMAEAFSPERPLVIENELGVKNDNRYKIQFSYEYEGFKTVNLCWIFGVILLVLGIGYCWKYKKSQDEKYYYLLGSLAVLGFNFAMHTIFGTEAFLYSPHWHPASLVLVLILISTLQKTLQTPVVATTLIFVMINNFYVIKYMHSTLN